MTPDDARPSPGSRAVYVTPRLVTVHVADRSGTYRQVGKAEPDRTSTRSGFQGLETLCDADTLRWVLKTVTAAHLAWLDDPATDLTHMATHTLGRVPDTQRSTLIPIPTQEALL